MAVADGLVVLTVDDEDVTHFVLAGLALEKVAADGVAHNVLFDHLGNACCLGVLESVLVAIGAVDTAGLVDLGLGTGDVDPKLPTKSFRYAFLTE